MFVKENEFRFSPCHRSSCFLSLMTKQYMNGPKVTSLVARQVRVTEHLRIRGLTHSVREILGVIFAGPS
jgi:hypothetical protein